MIIYFSIYCFLGYLMESLYVSILQRKWISSGLFHGPFIPLYGFGAIILILLSPYVQNHFFLTFLVGSLCLTLLEYVSSLFIEKYFHTKCWDYSHHHLHYQGRICLLYSLIWGFLSVLFIFYIHPYILSLSLHNDMCCMLSLIYIAFLFKSISLRIQSKNGLDIH